MFMVTGKSMGYHPEAQKVRPAQRKPETQRDVLRGTTEERRETGTFCGRGEGGGGAERDSPQLEEIRSSAFCKRLTNVASRFDQKQQQKSKRDTAKA